MRMQKLGLLLTLFCLCLAFLVGCGSQKDYLKFGQDDITVSLPEKPIKSDTSNSQSIEEKEKELQGVWKLLSVTVNNKTTQYDNSYYIFNKDGSYAINLDNNTTFGEYSVKEDGLHLGSSVLTYQKDGNHLTLTTQSGKVHALTLVGSVDADANQRTPAER